MSTAQDVRPVVVGYLDRTSDTALDWAAEEAARRQVPLRVVSSYTHEETYPWGYGYVLPAASLQSMEDHARERAGAAAQGAVDRASERHPGLDAVATVARASAAAALVNVSQDAGLLVVGARPRSFLGSFGSVSLSVAAHAGCPVVVVPEPAEAGAGKPVDEAPSDHERPVAAVGQVVVGVDASPEGSDAIGFAFEQASARGCGLTALHAWWVDPELLAADAAFGWNEVSSQDRNLVDDALAPWLDRFPDVSVTRVVGHGGAPYALCAAAEGAELLVVGSRGRGGFASLLLGSVSRAVLMNAPVPTAVVRRGQLGAR